MLAEDLFWAICQKILQASSRELQRGARGARGPRAGAVGHLLLQLLDVPVAARLLGDRSALPDHADPPAERGADAPRGARRHHLRLGRQDRPLHRPPRRQERARAAPAQRRATTTSASSWSAPTRRSSATCTTCSATPTRCTSRWRRGGGYQIEHVVAGDTVTDVLRYVSYARDDLVARVRQAAEHGAARQAHDPRGVAPAAAHLRRRALGLHLSGAGLSERTYLR